MNYYITKAEKSDKKDIQRFYKSERYSACFIGYDQSFIIKERGEIIASVIVSARFENFESFFLHGLVVTKQYRNKGIAHAMLNYISEFFTPLYCFCEQALCRVYLSANFKQINEHALPNDLQQSYCRYKIKQPTLCCFSSVDRDKSG